MVVSQVGNRSWDSLIKCFSSINYPGQRSLNEGATLAIKLKEAVKWHRCNR